MTRHKWNRTPSGLRGECQRCGLRYVTRKRMARGGSACRWGGDIEVEVYLLPDGSETETLPKCSGGAK